MLEKSYTWENRLPDLCKLTADNNFDAHTAVLLDVEDTRYVLKDAVSSFHQLSKQYYFTDRHLWHFMAAVLDPDTKGACKRVNSVMQGKCG